MLGSDQLEHKKTEYQSIEEKYEKHLLILDFFLKVLLCPLQEIEVAIPG